MQNETAIIIFSLFSFFLLLDSLFCPEMRPFCALFLFLVISLSTLSWGWRVNSAFNLHRLSKLKASEATSPPLSGLKAKLSVDMKEAMKAKEKVKLAAIRSIQTAIKQTEVDQRVELT